MPVLWIYFILTVLGINLYAPPESIQTAAQLWDHHPERLRSLFRSLDLMAPELSDVYAAIQKQDTVGAAELLVDYYSEINGSWVFSTLDPMTDSVSMALANVLLYDSIIIGTTRDKVPTINGGWQWDYTGPHQDDEFGYSLNGHKYLPALLHAWQNSDDAVYAQVFDKLIKDWVIQHPLPQPGDSIFFVLEEKGPDYRNLGEVEWRTLEAGNRLGVSWPQLFYGFQGAKNFTTAAKLLMLTSLADQADFLLKYHKKGHNWTTMEMNGLALAGLAFPEFKEASKWTSYALNVMEQEINRQVYPDGVQTELSTKTQWVALHRFESLAVNFQKAGREISGDYLRRVEEMYNYLGYSIRPDGYQPLNNDADREDLRPRLLNAASKFDRADWQWIATNGKQGTKPDSLPSVTFPWAGIHVMRSGWDEKAHWSFFDTGVFGTGHQHADKLHLSVTAYGQDLLVDGGRYTHKDYFSFDPTIWRGYFRSSFSHNVILVDGQGQNGGPTMTNQPLRSGLDYIHQADFDFAKGKHTAGYTGVAGLVEHSRSVLYLHDKFWIVVDQLETDRPRELQVLWHYAPAYKVMLEEKEAVSVNPGIANLRIVPMGDDINWQPELVSGQEKPNIQGWYSANYGIKEPNTTVVYNTSITGPATFAWLLVPAHDQVPKYHTNFRQRDSDLEITITRPDDNPIKFLFPAEGVADILD